MHDSNHKAQLYKYLWMLMVADSPDAFQELLATKVLEVMGTN